MISDRHAQSRGVSRWLVTLVVLLGTRQLAAQFVRPEKPDDPRIWGIEGGIVVGVFPDFHDSLDRVGPRGLIRLGLLVDGKPQLINFVSVEPLVGKSRGLSELERSEDGEPGKRFRLSNRADQKPRDDDRAVRGVVRNTKAGRVLSFAIHVDPFANGARAIVEVSLFEKEPSRVCFRTFAADGSAPIDELTLSATMGNMARVRSLWLEKGPVSSLDIYRGYNGDRFIEKSAYPLDTLHRTKRGEVVLAVTPDEFDAREAWPFADGGWRCPVGWRTQYWLKRKGEFDDSIVCRVNGRRTYWRSKVSLPGGIAYENFEFREKFHAGQESWFGIDERSPAELFGFSYDLPPRKPLL
ncbi:MAG: hypothetical protein KDC38_13260, partial [Planctomycetes bacterium]|nr:hypothetical protein [Planctomycetota bacterium]